MHGYGYNVGRKIWTHTLPVACTCGITRGFTQTPAIHYPRQGKTHYHNGRRRSAGFSLSLIRSALIRPSNSNIYISAQESMTVCVFIHSNAKRAETISLLNSGAMENFLNINYAKWLNLPIKRLPYTRKLFNVDGMENNAGELQFYTDLAI